MNKLLILILFFFSLFQLNGQDNEIEDFINQTCFEFVPKDFEYFNLLEKSYNVEFDEYSLSPQELKKILKDYPDFPHLKFIEKAKDTITLNWRSFIINKSRIYSYDSIPKFQSGYRINRLVDYKTPKSKIDSLNRYKKFNEVIIPVKKLWGKSRVKKEIAKKWKEYENSIVKENRFYFRFYKPIIINDFAIITYGKSSGTRKSFIYKKENGVWEMIFMFDFTVS